MSDDVPSLAAPRPLPNLSGHHLVIRNSSLPVSGPVGTPMGPGSAPPMNPPFDAYYVCIQAFTRSLSGTRRR